MSSGSTAARGYTGRHRRERSAWESRLRAAGALPCADPAPGCPGLVRDGSRWDLAHDHRDRSRYLGPAHQRCNRWWAAYLTNMRARSRRLRVGQVAPAGVFGPLSS